jgi:phosphinothricin acetyltransferase
MKTRDAAAADAPAIARIYNEGIDDRVATFETRHRTAEDVVQWLDGRHPVVVVEDEDGGVIAFAATSAYRPRDCYAGIAEFSVYAARAARGRGAGRMAMQTLFVAARGAGFWKLVSRVFVENDASRNLLRSIGFREVGVYERHAQLAGVWRDVVIVERLLTPPSTPQSP